MNKSRRMIFVPLTLSLIVLNGASERAFAKPRHVTARTTNDEIWIKNKRVIKYPGEHGGQHTSGASANRIVKRKTLPSLVFDHREGNQAFCTSGGRAPDVFACPIGNKTPVARALPQVTGGYVLTALRRVGLPALQAHTQPEDKTLVNFATNFYTDPAPIRRTFTLLGQSVSILATPNSYTWHYGDGQSATTTGPGAKYPALDITHAYEHAYVTVSTSVDVTYAAKFRVGGGAWQNIPGTVTIAGPTAPLRISEATAVLSGDDS